jgi:hypothetical protein
VDILEIKVFTINMKRLSKIDESVWADIHKRSNGSQERKEDDINVMDMDMFFEYLQGLYKPTMPTYNVVIYHDVPRTMILVPISINGLYSSGSVSYVSLELDKVSDKKIVTLDIRSLHRLPEGCEYKLKEMYKIKYMSDSPKRQAHIIINPKDSSDVTNKFYIEIIDFMLDNIKDGYNRLVKKVELTSYVGESIWADIHKRSNGNLERKEDDISSLDRDGLYEHIFNVYEMVNDFPDPFKSQTSQAHTYFSIPIFKSDYKIYRLDVSFYLDVITKITLMASDVDIKDFKQPLIDNFDVTIRDDGALKIEDKNGNVSNQVCMDLIKVIVENAPQPLLKKRD